MMSKQSNPFYRDKLPFSKSLATLSRGQSTQIEYSLLTGKHIRTNKQIQTDIKVKRILSYQKISFSIRKMDEMFKASNKKIDQPLERQVKKKQRLISSGNVNGRIANKEIGKSVEKNKNSKQKLKICLQTNTTRPQSYNICTNGQFIQNFDPLKLAERTRNYRIKTSYSSGQSQARKIENQNMNEQQPQNRIKFAKSKANRRSIIKLLKDEKQQSILDTTDRIPGINYKKINNIHYQMNPQLNHTKSSFVNKSISTYIHAGQLLSGDTNQTIEKMFLLRRSQDLLEKPKQWHLYNCLRLNNIQLYRTNLKLSCQNWIIIDHRELKYLRGWNPKQTKEFSVSIKLFVSAILLNLNQNHNLDLDKTKYRINNQLIIKKIQKIQKKIIQNPDFSLKANTIISLQGLLTGMFVSKRDDITWHLIYTIGYLYKKYNFYGEVDQKFQTQSDQIIYLNNDQLLIKQYECVFIMQCKQLIERLQIQGITFAFKKRRYKVIDDGYKIIRGEIYENSYLKQTNEHEYLSIKASPVQIGILFLDCLSYPKFNQFIVPKKLPIQVHIRFQVGNNYWENRIHTWSHHFAEFRLNNNNVVMAMNNGSNNYALVAYNCVLQTIVVCNDCKTNMCKKDLQKIQEWMQISFKRFNKSKNNKSIAVDKQSQRDY